MFEIQRMGCSCRHDSSFLLDQPQGYDVYLMLFVKTRAVFRLDGEYRLAEPSTFILYDRNTPLYYGASGGDYINDWALFDCTEPLQAEAKVRFNELIPIGEQIDLPQYFQLIADSFFRGANTNSAGLLIRAMLTEIFSAPVSKGWTDLPHYRELLDLRRQLYAQPDLDWDAQKMAQQVNISVPYLHALYKKAFGVTCAADPQPYGAGQAAARQSRHDGRGYRLCLRLSQQRAFLAAVQAAVRRFPDAVAENRRTVSFSSPDNQTGRYPLSGVSACCFYMC